MRNDPDLVPDPTSDFPLPVYERGLRSGSAVLRERGGRIWPMPTREWSGAAGPEDARLVERCTGPTLDVGCGPGRLAAALQSRGLVTLGIDVSPMAVTLTRSRGVSALQRDVFADVPGEHRWAHVLLADGNIGIGGDPLRLLARCAELLEPSGSVLLDLAPPGSGLRVRDVRLESGEEVSDWFPWAWVAVDALHPIASAAGLGVRACWRSGLRWQAELVPSDAWHRDGRGGRAGVPEPLSPRS